MDDIELAAEHWDEYTKRYAGRRTGLYWYELPGVMNHINFRISGRPDLDWIEYTVGKHLPKSRAERCISLGCGTGQLERSLARLNVFQRCDAYDVSEESISAARQKAPTRASATFTTKWRTSISLNCPSAGTTLRGCTAPSTICTTWKPSWAACAAA